MQSKKSNFRWLIKLIFLVVFVVGQFFSLLVEKSTEIAVLADAGTPCDSRKCNCMRCPPNRVNSSSGKSSCDAAGCSWYSMGGVCLTSGGVENLRQLGKAFGFQGPHTVR
jgi:hypothetical protein